MSQGRDTSTPIDQRQAVARLREGVACHEQSRLAEAVACYRAAVALDPALADAHHNCGVALQALGRPAEAADCYAAAARLRPGDADALHAWAVALLLAGDAAGGVAALREAIAVRPDHPHALNNLGVTLLRLGDPAAAADVLWRCVAHHPDHAEARVNLGNALAQSGELPAAAAAYRQALALRPGDAQALNNLAAVHQAAGETDEAVRRYRELTVAAPAYADGHRNLAVALAQQGRTDDAAASLRRAVALAPSPGQRVALATLLPQVYASADDRRRRRQRYAEEVAALETAGVRIDLAREPAVPPFFLAYQGMNDRDLQRRVARLHRAPEPLSPRSSPRPRGGKVRVGIVSAFVREHTVGRLTRGVIEHLPRDAFEVVVFSVGTAPADPTDAVAAHARRHADAFVTLPAGGDGSAARAAIADADLDVLYYPELGMNADAYRLAFSRLAPVQCVTWGHPVTTGIDTVDHFVSSELLEPADADAHYTERLVRLSGLAIGYDRPAAPPPRTRADFGLPAGGRLYGCPQSLFKFHPDFDPLLADVVRRDPCGWIVLLRAPERLWDEQLLDRLRRTAPAVVDRVRFVPRQSPERFLALLRLFDVMLDPPHFGGGHTTLEALAMGVPVVTLPSAFLRGRMTLGIYRALGVTDCVAGSAEQYADLAVRLANDAGFRRDAVGPSEAGGERLYGDPAGVHALGRFFHEACDRHGDENPH